MNRVSSATAHCQNKEMAMFMQAAARAALTAGSIVRELYGKPHTIQMKGPINLVTESDLAAETAIIASLNEDAPGIAVLAEESADDDNLKEPEGKVWVVDPLDGTTNFAHGLPLFAVSVALLDDGAPQVGAIYCPMQDELFTCCRGGGAWLDGREIRVTETRFLLESLVATGFPYDIYTHLDTILGQLKAVLPKVRDIRRCGAAAVDLAYVACGRLDGFWEMDLKPWDTAAGWLLVEEAGGKVTGFDGRPYSAFARKILASNGVLHSNLLELLS